MVDGHGLPGMAIETNASWLAKSFATIRSTSPKILQVIFCCGSYIEYVSYVSYLSSEKKQVVINK